MANKKTLNLGSTQANKIIAELPEKREKIKAHVQFRNELLESQKRVHHQNECDRLQGAKRIIKLQPSVKSRMKELQQKESDIHSKQTHAIYETKCMHLYTI